jgi:hypothetical protein
MLCLVTPFVAAAEISILTTRVAAGIVEVRAIQGGVEIDDTEGAKYRVVVGKGSTLSLMPSTAPRDPADKRPDMLPDGVVSRGNRNITAAWLIRPTTRYAHGVLGDAIEASGLSVQLADGTRHDLILGEGSVFEDRLARIADFNGDGQDEILIVRSYLDRGAALAVVGSTADGLRLIAEAPAIGRPYRWLNPVDVADFDGDGENEAAVVVTPHIGGTLKLYRMVGENLREVHSHYGFSNHALGSRELGMGTVIDINSDGVPDLLIPDETRRALRIVTFAGGQFRELARLPHGSAIVTALVASDVDGNGATDVVYGLADGTLLTVLFTP